MATSEIGYLDRIAIEVAMVFGVGRIKKAPGTFGSIPGLLVGWYQHKLATAAGAQLGSWAYPLTLLLLLGITIAVAWWSIARTEQVLGIHDDQRIVIDEVAGQAVAVCALPLAWPWYLAAFGLFRLLDITKPGLIGRIDRDAPGAFGTLMDDVLAGVVAAAVLLGALYFLPSSMLG